MEKNLGERLDEAKALFDRAFSKAIKAVQIAKEELTREKTRDERYEEQMDSLGKGPNS